LDVLAESAPDVRIVNLETSVTRSDQFAPNKAVHYRMNPANRSCLVAARPDVCALANNHVLDLGHRGLEDTLDALTRAGLHGHSSHHPRPIEVYQGRLILYGCGDLINDYEGISGYEKYRDDLRLMYLASVDANGALVGLRMVPMQRDACGCAVPHLKTLSGCGWSSTPSAADSAYGSPPLRMACSRCAGNDRSEHLYDVRVHYPDESGKDLFVHHSAIGDAGFAAWRRGSGWSTTAGIPSLTRPTTSDQPGSGPQ
jgi:hypothetical protein